MEDISNYEKIREDSQKFYSQIGAVSCPAFDDELVYFNSEGFNHLVYKRSRGERSKNDQITKFKLLAKAKEIIQISTTFQEYEEGLIEVVRKKYKGIVKETLEVHHWGFVAVVRGWRVKVVIRQIGNGQKHFWSVIPAWVTNQYKDVKLICKSKGDLSED